MSLPSFITAVGQPAFTTEARVSNYVITQALGANEPTALFIKARYWQTRADYARDLRAAALANMNMGVKWAFQKDFGHDHRSPVGCDPASTASAERACQC